MNENTQLCDISNLLLQKWPAPEFKITTCLHLDELVEGDRAGLLSLGGHYQAILIQREQGKNVLYQRTGNWTKNDEERTKLLEITNHTVFLRMKVEKEEWVSYEMSEDGVHYQSIGTKEATTPGRWVGVKVGLTIFNELSIIGGKLKADYFIFER